MAVFIREPDYFSAPGERVVTLGFFDGAHLGHQALLKRLRELSAETGLPSLVLTFDARPSERSGLLLTTLEERLRLLAESGADTVVVQPFTETFSSMSSEEFLRRFIKEKFRAKVVLAGYDCRFGKGREGNIETLKNYSREFGYLCEEEQPLRIGGEIVSSTACRELLRKGELSKLGKFLGRPWALQGTVEAGKGLGRELGYPTANLALDGLLTPPKGVYGARYELAGESGKALLYLGDRPTFPGREKAAEAFLLDFSGDLYGRELRITPEVFLGEEKRYADGEELRKAISNFERRWREGL